MTTNLDPIAILEHKAQDPSLSTQARALLTDAILRLSQKEWWDDYESALDTLT